MSKVLKTLSKKKYYDPKQDLWVISLNAVQKAFEPPTAEEVCEALSEHNNGGKVFYENGEFYVKGNSWKVNITKCYKTNGKLYIAFCTDIFPPHLVTLISRFYEGVITDE